MLVLVFLVFGTLHAAAPPESNRSYHQQPVGQPAVDESRHAEEPRRVLQVVEPWKGHHDEKEFQEENDRPFPLKSVVKCVHLRGSPSIYTPLGIAGSHCTLCPHLFIAVLSRRLLHVGTFPLSAELRKLFKNPCSQAELNKIVPFGFSLQRQKNGVFFAIKIV